MLNENETRERMTTQWAKKKKRKTRRKKMEEEERKEVEQEEEKDSGDEEDKMDEEEIGEDNVARILNALYFSSYISSCAPQMPPPHTTSIRAYLTHYPLHTMVHTQSSLY